MRVHNLELEGTWDEINQQVPDFDGKRLHVTVRIAEEPRSAEALTVDEALKRIWKTVPDSSWQSFSSDFGDNMDHYLYGSAKSA